MEDWGNASITYYNLSELYGQLGELDASEDAATKALAAALSVNKASAQIFALARLGWVSHLKGYLDRSSSFFERAQILERRVSNVQFLYGQRGIKFADHLRCIGSVEQARRVIEFNLEIARSYPSPNDISCSYRVLGDLEAAIENHPNAKHFYNEALKIARSISIRATLIEVLQARGNWAAGQGEAEVAQGDLDEALSYAISSNYRIYEIDIRVALSKLYLKLNKSSSAQVEMKKVKQMSDEIGYYWGQVASKNYQNF